MELSGLHAAAEGSRIDLSHTCAACKHSRRTVPPGKMEPLAKPGYAYCTHYKVLTHLEVRFNCLRFDPRASKKEEDLIDCFTKGEGL